VLVALKTSVWSDQPEKSFAPPEGSPIKPGFGGQPAPQFLIVHPGTDKSVSRLYSSIAKRSVIPAT
jgi:hypothetical protein